MKRRKKKIGRLSRGNFKEICITLTKETEAQTPKAVEMCVKWLNNF